MQKPWIAHYPPGVPAEIDIRYASLCALMEDAFAKHRTATALRFMGARLSYGELDEASQRFAAHLQGLGLQRGDRVALMMPNVLQYPVAIAGVLRAGLVIVNVNPLYTPHELRQQLVDCGARAIVLLENMAHTFEAVRAEVPVEHVILTAVGDMLPAPKRWAVNAVVRHVRKLVPAYSLPGAKRWRTALAEAGAYAPVSPGPDDVASLQYTGGTTGTPKGATLTHANLVANVLQSVAWFGPALDAIPKDEEPLLVCALPLYHIFGFTVNLMLGLTAGATNLLILNPRDIPALLKELKRHRFHFLPAVNTLFGAIARHPAARDVDWSSLKLSVGGGMAVQPATAKLWRDVTGCGICEGYGLSESAPVAACNPTDRSDYTGTIGLPLPSTTIAILDDAGAPVPPGTPGELAIHGPQVMAGYWKRPDETSAVMTQDGFLRTGDIAVMDEAGWFRIVDRKKDMINVSGFNVYPGEIEEAVTRMPGVVEAAAIAVPDDTSGEAVKLFVVRSDPSLTAESVKAFCRQTLTGYKRPRHVEFRDDLPKSGVGKILRRALREG
ncbi:AMP-binding protein [Aurantimonas sp. MSK8Z-1]|uniref:AMP-binding protein n=1 Tax=Mangrovibrevibacter kandeliae TaxID=2968473 RepID=UPI0021180BA9|nr:AMP-binding protein [Aurantimonas sp. MSK8Z-1]MCW4117070.1 AMP-binding protein [Aurantimonas sp. MSK8Z-1]